MVVQVSESTVRDVARLSQWYASIMKSSIRLATKESV